MTETQSQPTLPPYLTVKGAKAAVAFYQKVFDAEITGQMDAEDGARLMHASLLINDGLVMLSDEFPEFGPDRAPNADHGSSVAISLTLETPSEVDRIYNLALENGATEHYAPEDMFWGDRFAQLIDPWHHRWMLVAALEK